MHTKQQDLKTFKRMLMRALKNNWLSAGITLLFLLGAFFLVKGRQNQTNLKPEKTQTTYWFPVDLSGNISGPSVPKPSSPECNSANTHSICGVELTVPVYEGSLTDAQMLGYTTGQYTRRKN